MSSNFTSVFFFLPLPLEEHFPLECVTVHGGRGLTPKNKIVWTKRKKKTVIASNIDIFCSLSQMKRRPCEKLHFTKKRYSHAWGNKQTKKKNWNKTKRNNNVFLSRRKSTTFRFRLASVTAVKTSGTGDGVDPRVGELIKMQYLYTSCIKYQREINRKSSIRFRYDWNNFLNVKNMAYSFVKYLVMRHNSLFNNNNTFSL